MARIEVVMPQMGESIAEGTILKWHKKVGDAVARDETLLEISTDKVDSEIPSPAAGILAEIVVKENETVPVRTVIAYLETDEAGGAARLAQKPPAGAGKSESVGPASTPPAGGGGKAPEVPVSSSEPRVLPTSGRFYSPLVLSMARAEGVPLAELETIPGHGEAGRLTKKDLQDYLRQRKSGGPVPAAPAPAVLATPSADEALRKKYPGPGFEVLQMSNVLQRMAQHMVQSVQTSPHVAAIHEVDMTNVVRSREANAQDFARREGFKLTFTPYVVAAVVAAIKQHPLINSSVEGDKIIRKSFIHLGIAVASDSGLIVPVIKHAEEKNFLGLARAVNDLALRTRARKLTPEDIQGGTFTISNYGVFGTMIGTPIINQPQVAILGTGAVTKRVAVVNDALAIRSLAYFTLSFDHRIVDGALGGMFLAEVVRRLEQTDPEARL